jgi:membrane protein DedA with SNARE-associated domain
MIGGLLQHLAEFLQQLAAWSVQVVDFTGYQGIVFLMFLESSFIPFPSELVMPQAGYLAQQGKMNIGMAIGMGVAGSWLGALLNYYLALRLGRPFFLKYGKYLLCPPETFAKVERFFVAHGEIGTFTGRLVPVIRQYVSLPAGLGRMNMARFLFYTGLGSGLWVAILAWIGYVAGQNRELIKRYSHQATLAVLVACAVLMALYVWNHRRKRRRAAAAPPPPSPAP